MIQHNDIELQNLSKLFEFERICREIDGMNEKNAKEYCKLCVKLYLQQQEVLSNLGNI